MTNHLQPDSRPGSQPDRRTVLRGLVAAGALGLTGGVAAAAPGAHLGLLDLAATTEALRTTLYHTVLSQAEFVMDADAVAGLQALLDGGQAHLRHLRKLGGAAAAGPYFFPESLTQDARVFVHTAHALESVAAAAYVAATRDFAALGQPDLAATAAGLGARAAQHHMVISGLAGVSGSPLDLSGGLRRMADVQPLLAPYLKAGTGRRSIPPA